MDVVRVGLELFDDVVGVGEICERDATPGQVDEAVAVAASVVVDAIASGISG